VRTVRRIVPLITLLALAATGPPAHAVTAEHVPGELIVGWKPGVRAAERAALIGARGGSVLHRFRTIDAERIRVDGDLDSVLAALVADPRVAFAEPNTIVHADALPDDPRFSEQWALRNTGQTGGAAGADVDAVAAWDVFTGSPDLPVGVIDSGIDLDHPDLAGNLWTNPGEIPGNQVDDDGNGYVDDVHGWNFVTNGPNCDDDFGHGTHVAGILAARTGNGIGVAGLAWRAQLVAIKFLDQSGSGTTAAAIEALEYATALGLRITNNSWGGPAYSEAMRAAIAAAGAAGQIVVAAAGNRAEDNDAVGHYPSNYDLPNVVAVAATDSRDALASFSNFGAASVDIAAPGTAILSCVPGGGYGLSSGTSMATPFVSATLALLIGRSPGLTTGQAIDLLLGGAEVLPSLQGRVVGARRLNALRAVSDPDTVAPGAVQALTAHDPGSNTVVLDWIASGDDGDLGRASGYDIRFATAPIDSANVANATGIAGPLPAAAGAQERFEVGGLAPETTYWFAVRARDEYGNLGPLPAPASATTLGPPQLGVSPEALLLSLPVGAKDTALVMVANTAEGTLDFTLPPIALAFPPAPPVPIAEWDASAKGEDGAAGPPVAESAGGPDAAGYRWKDSRDPAGPVFEWIEITADGTRVPVSGDDALSAPLDMGFDFPFYGQNVRALRVSTNGALTFSATSVAPVNQFLPSASAPPLLIAPFWDDLLFASIERAWYRADPGRFVITWLAVPHYGSGGPYTFQAVLYAGGEIRFQYLTMGTATLSATAGIQNGDGSVGLTVAHNTAFFTDSLAVRIVPLPQWATVAPAGGRLGAGEQTALRVSVDARGLQGGAYDATLRILSNDSGSPERSIPIRLLSIGAPDIVLEPPAVSFGDVFVGASGERSLKIRNPGTEWLHLGVIETPSAAVAVDASLFSVPPGGARTITVSFTPDAAGELNGALRVHSNVAGGSVTEVPLSGRGVPPPVLAVAPPALAVALPPQEETLRTVMVRNEGATTLTFNARATTAGAPVAAVRDAAALEPAGKRAPDRGAAVPAAAAGDPDAFGYAFRTSDEPAGPSFEWIDATVGGERLALSGDDAVSAAVPIGFDFPFYGAPQRAFRVCTNGWMSFTSTLAAFSNTVLPSAAAGVPENLVAPYWDDFHFGESQLAWVKRLPDRIVVEWHEVGRLDDASRPNTFQAVLHADGRIRFQYLRMKGENLASGTAGIQNAARDDGLTAAYNARFAHDSLAIEFTPPARWFEIAPAAGAVPPGGTLPIEVRIRPHGLHGGLYTGAIALITNDPLRTSVAVPCSLTVIGAPALQVPAGGIALDPVYAGFPRHIVVDVANAGTAAFDLDHLSASDPALSARLDPPRIEADATGRLRVDLAPRPEGTLDATLTLAPRTGAAVTIPIRASVAAAPRAVTSATHVEATLARGLGPEAAERTRTLVVTNEGGSPLPWSADALLIGLPAPRAISEAGRGSVRPKGLRVPAGAVGPRGPDAAGYHWTSDREGGPAFEWVDTGAAGAAVDLAADDALSAPIALPFRFPFYEGAWDSVRVCSNGYLTFVSGPPSYAHVMLPANAAPRALIAPCWADFDLRPAAGAGRVRTATVDGRFVISFLDVPPFGGGPPASFQVVLASNGDIDFQYLDAGTGSSDATVGLQNARGDVGLLVVHGAPFLENGLRVSIRRRAPWLSVAPASGVVPPGGRDTLRVTFAAGEWEDGVHSGVVRLRTADPARPDRILAANLRIGRVPVEVALETTRGGSGTPRWVEALVTPPSGIAPAALAAARPRLAGANTVGAGTVYEDGTVGFRFPRLPVLAGAPASPLALAGAVEGTAWVYGSVALRNEGPGAVAGPAPAPAGGEAFSVTWAPRAGMRVDVHLSLDGGSTWRTLAAGIEDGVLRAIAPREGAEAAWLELEAFDAAGHAGSAFLGPFAIAAGAPLPERFALAVAGARPAAPPVALDLSMPAEADVRVDVFDLRGARIATLARGRFPAGRHRLRWAGLDPSGGAAAPGVYFVRAVSGSEEARARIVLVR